jgi:hypothetical protein
MAIAMAMAIAFQQAAIKNTGLTFCRYDPPVVVVLKCI